jgi:hypothetical protein
MPRNSTFPTLYDECKTVTITFLNRWGYLRPSQIQSGTISWSRNGTKTGSISVSVNTHTESPYLELEYKRNETPINYRVQIVSAPSNLGKGVVWYFVCPHTGKRCRKLHLIGTYFYHRSAFAGCFYEKQIESHYYRSLGKLFGNQFLSERVYEQIYSKHFKKQYAGKPTKRYLKLLAKQTETTSLNLMDALT